MSFEWNASCSVKQLLYSSRKEFFTEQSIPFLLEKNAWRSNTLAACAIIFLMHVELPVAW
jgi:hypothetical protein